MYLYVVLNGVNLRRSFFMEKVEGRSSMGGGTKCYCFNVVFTLLMPFYVSHLNRLTAFAYNPNLPFN